MKNPTREECAALRRRAEAIASRLPPLSRGPDGRLAPDGARAVRWARG